MNITFLIIALLQIKQVQGVLFLILINFLSPIASTYIYAGVRRANEMIGRSGLTRQAERTNAYSSIAEEGTSSRARLNAKSKMKGSVYKTDPCLLCKCTRLCSAPISVTTTDSSRTAPSRHTQIHTYRCFRQDLTRFVRFMLRKNPSFNTSYCGQAPQKTPSVGNSFQI